MIRTVDQNSLWYGVLAGVFFATLPAMAARADSPNAPFVAGFERFVRHDDVELVIGGQLLLTELSCTACHASPAAELKPKRGPILDGAGNRLNPTWIGRFLAAPHKVKPGTTMPEVLSELPATERAAAISALVAFIGSLERPFPEFQGTGAKPVPNQFWDLGDVQQGQQLYHRIGCVACHPPDADYETVATKPTPLDQILRQLAPDELQELGLTSAARRVQSTPLGDVSAKYTHKSLTFFLLDPHRVRPAGRMPNFQLGVVEAADIAAWLLRDQRRQPTAVRGPGSGSGSDRRSGSGTDSRGADSRNSDVPGAPLVATGRKLFGDLGCSNCHEAGGVLARPAAKPLAELNQAAEAHCFGSPPQGAPHFLLDDAQTAAVAAAITAAASATTPPNAAQQVQLAMLRLNCLGCHERHLHGGVGRYRRAYFETYGNVDIGDEGRLPPPLTGVGQKLRPAWLHRVLQGKGSVRSHMRIRMPVFPADQVKSLPALIAQADDSGNQPPPDIVLGKGRKLAEAGRALLDTGCVQCHPLRGNALPGVVGIDLEGIAGRVQPAWFRDFLLNPGSLKPRTRMPTFFPDGRSQTPHILDGDAELQIAAIWTYLKDAGRYPLPAKIEHARSQSYELIPRGRPILLRTFMEEAGTHAIAVGFPQQVHFAFDAEQVRLAHAWRGRFLDAEGTWFVRFAPPAKPLGTDQISLPKGTPLAMLEGAHAPWPSFGSDNAPTADMGYRYLGYRLSQVGIPTFLYRYGHFEIEDRIVPDARQLVRTLKITVRDPSQSSASLWLRGHVGKTLQLKGRSSYTSETGLNVSVKNVGQAGELRRREDRTEWIIPLAFQRQTTIEVRYQW